MRGKNEGNKDQNFETSTQANLIIWLAALTLSSVAAYDNNATATRQDKTLSIFNVVSWVLVNLSRRAFLLKGLETTC